MIIDRRRPQRPRGSGFILPRLAADLDDQVEQVALPMRVVDAGDEIRQVVVLLTFQRPPPVRLGTCVCLTHKPGGEEEVPARRKANLGWGFR